MTIRLTELSAITSGMTPEEAKQWVEAVEEAAPVLNTIKKYLEHKLVETDVNMRLDTVLKTRSDVTMTLLTLQAKKDAMNAILDLLKPVD